MIESLVFRLIPSPHCHRPVALSDPASEPSSDDTYVPLRRAREGTARPGDSEGTARPGDSEGTARPGHSEGTSRPGDDPISDDGPTVIRRPGANDSRTPASGPAIDRVGSDQNEGTSGASGIGKGRIPAPPSPADRTPAAVAKVLLGQRLNQFRLDEMIGGGGMGAVFRAHDEQLDRIVAVKVIPFVGDDPELQRRFRNEAQSAARLDHPRIAKVFETGNDDRWHYIVFEYIEGVNIRDLVVRNGVLSVDEAVYFTMQLADALGHAGERGITHRDIKPSNIVIADGRIKLVDMGLARSDRFDFGQDMTASGVTLGTFDYISPEQAKDPRDADIRSDLYSLGCTLYFMLTGSPPYPGGTMLQKLLAHGSNPPPEIRERRSEVSEHLSNVLKRMLAKQPSDRYQDAESLVSDLKRVAVLDLLPRSRNAGPLADGGDAGVLLSGTRLTRLFEQHLPWVAATGLLLLVAAVLQVQAMVGGNSLTIPPSAQPPQLAVNRGPAIRPTNAPLTPFNPTRPDRGPDPAGDEAAADATGVSSGTESSFADPRLPPKLQIGPSKIAPLSPSEQRDSMELRPGDPAGEFNAQSDLAPRDLDEALQSDNVRSLLVVGERLSGAPAIDQDGRVAIGSLQAALDAAAEYNIGVIEIGVPLLRSPPVKIVGNEVIIRSTVGQSVIDWVMPSGGSAVDGGSVSPTGDGLDSVSLDSVSLDGVSLDGLDTMTGRDRDEVAPTMCSVNADQIEFQHLHFTWSVPETALDGGTLFELTGNHLFRLKDCAITVTNTGMRNPVVAFRIASAGDSDSAEERLATQLGLNNVIVRGEMSMIDLNHQSRFDLNWYNGLLAINGTMIESNGSPLTPEPNDSITLSFDQVTVDAAGGLVTTRISGNDYPLPVFRSATKTVFTTQPQTPQFEFLGLGQLGRGGEWLRLQGASNAYDADPTLNDPLVRLRTADQTVQTTRVNDLVTERTSWIQETLPRLSVRWLAGERPSDSPCRRIPADYRQNPASTVVGFEESLLPPLDPTGTVNPVVPRDQAVLGDGKDTIPLGPSVPQFDF